MSEQIMFRSYGLFWREDRIFWGQGNVKGHLLGREVDQATGKTTSKAPIDFRDQIGIYALYDDFKLVYIGQAGSKKENDDKGTTLFDRLKDHRDDRLSERWDRFSWFGLRDVKSSEELTKLRNGQLGVSRGQILDMFEGVVIAFSEPKLNLQRGKLNTYATQYSQEVVE